MHRESIKIKGTKNGLVILLDSTQRFEDIKYNLLKKMQSSNGFFRGARFTFHPESKKLVPQQEHELETICKQYGLIPNTTITAPEIEALFSPRPQKKKETPVPPGQPALLLKRTLRSGQFISHPSHIVILGNVHPGAKVEAGGNIMVMGHCWGTLHAGVMGDRSASITAVRLAPQVLRIAGLTYSGEPPEKQLPGPHKALIKDNIIIFTSTG